MPGDTSRTDAIVRHLLCPQRREVDPAQSQRWHRWSVSRISLQYRSAGYRPKPTAAVSSPRTALHSCTFGLCALVDLSRLFARIAYRHPAAVKSAAMASAAAGRFPVVAAALTILRNGKASCHARGGPCARGGQDGVRFLAPSIRPGAGLCHDLQDAQVQKPSRTLPWNMPSGVSTSSIVPGSQWVIRTMPIATVQS